MKYLYVKKDTYNESFII